MDEIAMKNIFSSQIIITVQELNFHNMKQPSFDLVMPLKEIREEKEPKGLFSKIFGKSNSSFSFCSKNNTFVMDLTANFHINASSAHQ